MNRIDLLNVLQKLKNGIAQKDTVPEQTHICFEDNQVKVFNMNLAIKGKIEDSKINALIPGKRLLNLLEKIESETINFVSGKGVVTLKSKKNRYKMNALSNVDFPWIPIDKKVDWQKVDGEDFIECLKQSLFCTMQGDSGRALEGVCIWKGEFVVASDSKRLISCDLSKTIKKSVHCVIPVESAKAVINCGVPKQIAFVNGVFCVKYKDMELYSTVINDEFPSTWQSFFDEFSKRKGLKKIRFNEDCESGLERLALFAEDFLDASMNISFQDGGIKTMVEDETGSAEEVWESDGKGVVDGLKINPFYLKDALQINNEFIIGEKMILVQSKDKKFRHVIGRRF